MAMFTACNTENAALAPFFAPQPAEVERARNNALRRNTIVAGIRRSKISAKLIGLEKELFNMDDFVQAIT